MYRKYFDAGALKRTVSGAGCVLCLFWLRA